jgi:hypothetical protein
MEEAHRRNNLWEESGVGVNASGWPTMVGGYIEIRILMAKWG